jgi:hypothetical protein
VYVEREEGGRCRRRLNERGGHDRSGKKEASKMQVWALLLNREEIRVRRAISPSATGA